jgi:hypothetical protein
LALGFWELYDWKVDALSDVRICERRERKSGCRDCRETVGNYGEGQYGGRGNREGKKVDVADVHIHKRILLIGGM